MEKYHIGQEILKRGKGQVSFGSSLCRLGINAEGKLTAVNGFSDGFTDVFAKQSRQFSALIVLPTSDEIGNGIGTLTVKTSKKIVPTVDTECLRCDGESYSLQIRESVDHATTRNISLLVDLVSCILLADFKHFSELCNEVVHNNDFVT